MLETESWKQCSMENGDDWVAVDKVYHILFCFALTLIFSALANRTRYPFLRRYSVWVASILSLAAGAAKEVADEIGFFKSAGASPKDALADLLGVLIACLALSLRKSSRRPDPMDQVPGVSLVWVQPSLFRSVWAYESSLFDSRESVGEGNKWKQMLDSALFSISPLFLVPYFPAGEESWFT